MCRLLFVVERQRLLRDENLCGEQIICFKFAHPKASKIMLTLVQVRGKNAQCISQAEQALSDEVFLL